MRGRNRTDVHTARLRMLRDIAVPFAREMERAGQLDFDVFRDRTGRRGCLLGWMATLPAFQADGWSASFTGLPRWQDPDGATWTGYGAAGAYFGLDWPQTIGIFGIPQPGAACGTRWPTLSDRAELIDTLLTGRDRVHT